MEVSNIVAPAAAAELKTRLIEAVLRQLPDGRLGDNVISSTRYNLLTWLPVTLGMQFRRLANIYFLGVSVLMMIGTYAPAVFKSPVEPMSTISTLILVLMVTSCKEGYDDIQRFEADRAENCSPVTVVSWEEDASCEGGRKMVEVVKEQQNLTPGDIVKLEGKKRVPCDMVLLYTSNHVEGNTCYVETSNIDGETNLKIKVAPAAITANLGNLLKRTEMVGATSKKTKTVYEPTEALFRGKLEVEPPNNSIYTFVGALHTELRAIPLVAENLLLRSSVFCNTDWAYGICVYAGKETKIQMNNSIAPLKMSNIEVYANKAIIWVFLAQFILVTVSVISLFSLGYDQFYEKLPYVYPEQLKKNLDATSSYLPLWLEQWIVFLILFNNFIPISMYVTMELCTLGQADLISNDELMYDETLGKSCVVKTGNLVQELGQISHVFSDKTGTLTRNEMKLLNFTVKDELSVVVDNGIDGLPADLMDDPLATQNLYNLCRCLVVCHTVVREEEQTDEDLVPVEDGGGIMGSLAAAGGAFRRRFSSFSGTFASTLSIGSESFTGVMASVGKNIPVPDFSAMGDAVSGAFTGLAAGVGLRGRLGSNDSGHSRDSSASPPGKRANDKDKDKTDGDKDKDKGRDRAAMSRSESGGSLSSMAKSDLASEDGGAGGGGGGTPSKASSVTGASEVSLSQTGNGNGKLGEPGQSPGSVGSKRGGGGSDTDRSLQSERKAVHAEALAAKKARQREEEERQSEYDQRLLNRERVMTGAMDVPDGCDDLISTAVNFYKPRPKAKPKKERGYRAESPDELALVLGTRPFGCHFLDRTNLTIDVEIMGQGRVTFEQFAVNAFDADRKRMSVLMRHQATGQHILFCKGADANMLPLLDISPASRTKAEAHLRTYAKRGLRTLVIAQKLLSVSEATDWLSTHRAASTAMSGRSRKLSACAIAAEQGLELLGITAIEDRLQDEVPQVIADLATAGVTMWMLTGDKEETAVNIGTSCNLLQADTEVHSLTVVGSGEEFAARLQGIYDTITKDCGSGGASRLGSAQSLTDSDGGEAGLQLTHQKQNQKEKEKQADALASLHVSRVADDANLEKSRPVGFDVETEGEGEGSGSDKERAAAEGKGKEKGKGEQGDKWEKQGMLAADMDDKAQSGSSTSVSATGTAATKPSGAVSSHDVEVAIPIGTNGWTKLDSEAQEDDACGGKPARGQHALVIDGPSLVHLNVTDLTQMRKFLKIGSHCRSVIACRLTPIQKAQLVKMVKTCNDFHADMPKVLTIAIGDGANDVPMIQAADVGVGVFGKEGNQAANQADFAVSQFKSLRRLMLVHGRSSYLSQVDLLLYCLHKNMVLTMTLFWYSYYTSLSGTSLYESWIYSAFNLALGLPIIFYGILDRDLTQEFVLAHPEVYESSRTNSRLGNAHMMEWFANALAYAGCICCLAYLAFKDTFQYQAIYVMGTIVWTGLVMSLQAKVIFMSHNFAWPQILCMSISVGLMFPYFIMASYGTMAFYKQAFYLFAQPLFWFLGMFTMPAITVILVDGVSFGFRLFFAPTREMLFKEIELSELFRRPKWDQLTGLFRANIRKERTVVLNASESLHQFSAKMSVEMSVSSLRLSAASQSSNGIAAAGTGARSVSPGPSIPSADVTVLGPVITTPKLPDSLSQPSLSLSRATATTTTTMGSTGASASASDSPRPSPQLPMSSHGQSGQADSGDGGGASSGAHEKYPV